LDRASAGAQTLFRPGENCVAVAKAARAAFLVDGESYFRAFLRAAERAQRSIVILAWDFDSRLTLNPQDAPGDQHNLGNFLNSLCAARPHLRIRILDWDYPMVYGTDREFPPIYGLAWKPHPHIEFHYDDTHPLAGSHHQKIVAIDDRIAFCGGADLAARRWDTPAHAPDDPRRVFDGAHYPPVHDVQILVDGDAAKELARVACQRWHDVTGKVVPRHEVDSDPWPPDLEPDVSDVAAAIALTAPPVKGREEVRQVERLYLDMIERARRYIYMENQYFTSYKVGEALKKRLAEPDGPEIVLATRKLSHGWLEEMTMSVLRTKLVRELREADRHGRFTAACPHIEGLKEGTCIDLHSKVMIVDDEWLRIGSSNISNRSMGVDTECDVVIEARGEARVAGAIREFRDRLLAEHMGVGLERARREMERGSIGQAIERCAGAERKLCGLETPEIPETVLKAAAVGDPERPISIEGIVKEFAPEIVERGGVSPGTKVVAGAVVVAVVLALVWKYTPLADIVTPQRAIAWAQQFADYWWAPLAVIFAYTPASLIMFPRWLITLIAVAAFGPWAAFAYAQTGVLTAAILGYMVGEMLQRDTVRHMAGRRVNRLSEILRKRGLFAVTLVRLVPIAPFAVVNAVMGAMRIKLHHFIFGTVLGMLPGMLATTVLGDQVTAALADPTRVNGWLVALAGLALAALAGFGHWWLGREKKG
jgi:phospholipase D1/2